MIVDCEIADIAILRWNDDLPLVVECAHFLLSHIIVECLQFWSGGATDFFLALAIVVEHLADVVGQEQFALVVVETIFPLVFHPCQPVSVERSDAVEGHRDDVFDGRFAVIVVVVETFHDAHFFFHNVVDCDVAFHFETIVTYVFDAGVEWWQEFSRNVEAIVVEPL